VKSAEFCESLQSNIHDYCVPKIVAPLRSLAGIADSFSITAGAFGIAGVALQSITALPDDIQAVKNAPEVIADVKEELSAVEIVLRTLDSGASGASA
jgi:hypothetical protein